MNDMHNTKTLTIALIAALSLAMTPAGAGETTGPEKLHESGKTGARQEREIAADAIRAAADEAARSVVRETRLDLDIRLIGPTSPRIAGRK
jgi:hypothetical protein